MAKKETNTIKRAYRRSAKTYQAFSASKAELFSLINPFIENDTDVADDSICVDYLPGDGFAFMMDDRGVSIKEMIGRIEDLKSGERIKLSDLTPYL
ncbi:hypothetical protein [Dysgonomonas macrotermitis]|uniref:Uncharacterized protein n=1 Tax=Dysgonomonas macrotermitis TaxID=1346286 RepID=A0A1M4SB81_9BACT|nr:hypothetical protein [Dysgonomonas macrotermitis]SHE29466.1 hypothetical protein SAMN05444362_1019 [Dysgonomonas macrotermitis]